MIPWTVAHQAPLSMGFSRQEYWSGLPFSSPGNFSDPGIKPRSPTLQADTLPSEPPGAHHQSRSDIFKSNVFQKSYSVTYTDHLFQNFPEFTVIHIVKGFGIVNKAEIEVFPKNSKER